MYRVQLLLEYIAPGNTWINKGTHLDTYITENTFFKICLFADSFKQEGNSWERAFAV